MFICFGLPYSYGVVVNNCSVALLLDIGAAPLVDSFRMRDRAPAKRPIMLATISIRAKIISVVAFLLVAMTGMGLIAVMKMRAMNANTTDITTSWMPSVRVLC